MEPCIPKMEITLSVEEENALTLYEELERTDINPTNLNVNCCCGLLRTSPFHQPKPSVGSTERLHLPDPADRVAHSSSHAAQSDHHHLHHDHHRPHHDQDADEEDDEVSVEYDRWRHNVTRRNERYRAFGLLESSILNSFQLQNFRRKTPSVFDSSSSSGQTSCSSTTSSMIEDISDKIEEISKLDTNIHSLMYKSVELHNDILSLEATTNRLIADTRKLSDDLDDVRFLDELITILNGDIGPVIHREWPYKIDTDAPIEEGTPVT
ncbi:AGAP002012-PA-like protein [Anopheles sinensis]|uniref:AGAP002012-PA-like protein n=1 Tax=Anopheles sinensis TaxID=74873 RepID=A0A084VHC6_ANOSI|nr:AGAP002012-PA-like protein [Anopheles sinensis]